MGATRGMRWKTVGAAPSEAQAHEIAQQASAGTYYIPAGSVCRVKPAKNARFFYVQCRLPFFQVK